MTRIFIALEGIGRTKEKKNVLEQTHTNHMEHQTKAIADDGKQ